MNYAKKLCLKSTLTRYIFYHSLPTRQWPVHLSSKHNSIKIGEIIENYFVAKKLKTKSVTSFIVRISFVRSKMNILLIKRVKSNLTNTV